MNENSSDVVLEKTAKSSGRVVSVDLLRGFCLVAMVLVHFVIYFGNTAAEDTWIYFIFNHGLGDWGAAGFLIIMGISQTLSAEKHADKSDYLLFKRAFIRGLYIFIIGILMLLLAWGPYQIWQWDILTLMGFSTLVLFFCRYMPSWLILAISAAISFSTVYLRGAFDFASHWGNEFAGVPVISRYIPGIMLDPVTEYEAAWSIKDIVSGFFFTGYFPVFPWLMFPLIGFVMGKRIVSKRFRHDIPFIAIIGILLAFFGLAGAYAGRLRPPSSIIDGFVAPLSFYPDSFTMILAQLGLALIVISTLYYIFDIRKKFSYKEGFIGRILKRTSSFSLTFYFMHYILIGWSLAIVYFITGKYLLSDLMGSLPALLCGIAGVAVLETMLYFWEKHDHKFSLEWFLYVLTKRFTAQ